MTTTRKLGTSLVSAAAAGALALSGCSSGDGGEAATSSSSSSVAATSSSSSATSSTAAAVGPGPDADLATTTFPVDLDRALAVADEAVPGGVVTKIELEFERSANAWVWKIDSQKGTEQHEIKVDAQSGRVIADDRDQESANPVAVDPRKLTPKDATAKATALVPGAVAKWALEFDDGVQRYSFDIRTSGNATQDVDVDVNSGVATRN
ncbi:PepSY domain-containing protein [Mycolicibacterium hodleri]|nr:PepSY domain-containing protein [Mycolicibacterium hodleri]